MSYKPNRSSRTDNKSKMFTKESVLEFGKHKGETVEDVLKYDPSYLVWCIENLKWFDVDTVLDDEIYERDSLTDGYCSLSDPYLYDDPYDYPF